MENRINIAELLKDCPKGMELDCTTWENVTLEGVTDNGVYIKRNNKGPIFDKQVILNQYGCITNHKDEKCRIFPKGKTTWEGFLPPCQFKDGDIVINASNEDNNAFVYAGEDDFYYHSYVGLTTGTFPELSTDKSLAWAIKKSGIRLATEEEKQKLFKAIKDNGYKWNAENKTLEKLIEPRLKVGDKVVFRDAKEKPLTIRKVWWDLQAREILCSFEEDYIDVPIEDLDRYIKPKFDINTLVPFESRVLVRNSDSDFWKPAIFGCYHKDRYSSYYALGGTCWTYCIPHEGNEHLLGTTNDCDEFYKNWE